MTNRSIEAGSRTGRQVVTRGLAAAVALVFVLGACSDDETDSDSGTSGDSQEETIDELTAEVEEQTQRADDAEEALLEIAEQFPIEVTASLDDFDVRGAYTMKLTEAYCDGLPSCGAGRPDIRVDIVDGSNGLEIKVPNVFTAGLFDINGTLFAVTDSDLIVEPCAGTPRVARVTTTIFADGVSVAADGSRTLTGLGASLLVSTDAIDACTAGVTFWAATLTPA